MFSGMAHAWAGLWQKPQTYPDIERELARRAAYAREQAVARRIKASHQWIEDTIAVGQRRGLTPDRVSHYADGSIEVHFGDGHGVKKKPKGWDI